MGGTHRHQAGHPVAVGRRGQLDRQRAFWENGCMMNERRNAMSISTMSAGNQDLVVVVVADPNAFYADLGGHLTQRVAMLCNVIPSRLVGREVYRAYLARENGWEIVFRQ